MSHALIHGARRALILVALSLAAGGALAETTPTVASGKSSTKADGGLMYTTYFYTPAEAIIHGYEEGTAVRIVSLAEKRTVWSGVVGTGEVRHIPTGKGVFGFLSDKKASILVGTPSSCTVVGYWLRNAEGKFVGDHFYGQLPNLTGRDNRVLVWSWEDDVAVYIRNKSTKQAIRQATLSEGGYLELTGAELRGLGERVIEVRASKPSIAVQVYGDEGYSVPARGGRTSGRHFRTYVGTETDGQNDLNLIAYRRPAKIAVRDIKAKKILWQGVLEPGQIKTLTLAGKYVDIQSDASISALVAPFEHYKAGYAEHHYGAGLEGTGIDKEFYLTTPGELWVFSYYLDNTVSVVDAKTNKPVWSGKLAAGQVQGIHPGYGYYKVTSSSGISVMGGQHACGAEYSPAAGLFRVDEEVYKVATIILKERQERAARDGRSLTDEELKAPLTRTEADRAIKSVHSKTGSSLSPAEVQQRYDAVMAK